MLDEVVTYPAELSVKKVEEWSENGKRAEAYEIFCRKIDRGLIVGREGRNIKAIQHLIRIAGLRSDRLVFVYLEDDIKPYERD